MAKLSKLQQAIAQKKNGMSVTITVQGSQVSAQAAQGANCSTADLLADAKAQAQKMAAASGGLLGGVLAMSGSALSQSSTGSVPNYYYSGCSLTVRFALTGTN